MIPFFTSITEFFQTIWEIVTNALEYLITLYDTLQGVLGILPWILAYCPGIISVSVVLTCFIAALFLILGRSNA